jgi:hypothetical protein
VRIGLRQRLIAESAQADGERLLALDRIAREQIGEHGAAALGSAQESGEGCRRAGGVGLGGIGHRSRMLCDRMIASASSAHALDICAGPRKRRIRPKTVCAQPSQACHGPSRRVKEAAVLMDVSHASY